MSNFGRDNQPKESMLRAWLHPQVATMLFLGFSAGVPILLIFSTLSVWLREAGVARSAVTFFSWAALGYSFKFVWAPLIDKMPVPFLTRKLGRRRSWMLIAQFLVITAILWMALTNPAAREQSLVIMALAAVMLGFSSATQDIVIDAYRIECAPESLQAMLSSSYIAGYRIGMLVAGAGALYLADFLGTGPGVSYNYRAWMLTYCGAALVMLIGVATTLIIREPERNKSKYEYKTHHYARFFCMFCLATAAFVGFFFLSGDFFAQIKANLANNIVHTKPLIFLMEAIHLACALTTGLAVARLSVQLGIADREMVNDTYIAPVKDFFQRYGAKTALLLLLLVGFYRISDIVLGVVSNVFYLDLGFSKKAIAGITKTFGLIMTIAGGFLGGMLTARFGVMSILFLGALLSAATNLLFMLLASTGADIYLLTAVIAMDNLSAGLATAAFVAFLSSLTDIKFTAVQYAIFSSLMTLFPKLIGGYSGTMVSEMGYENFFFITTLMGIPVLGLVLISGKLLEQDK